MPDRQFLADDELDKFLDAISTPDALPVAMLDQIDAATRDMAGMSYAMAAGAVSRGNWAFIGTPPDDLALRRRMVRCQRHAAGGLAMDITTGIRTKVGVDAVTGSASTPRDNVDSIACPILTTFHAVELGHTSPNVVTDAVDTVNAVSTPKVDAVTSLQLGTFVRIRPAQLGRNGHRQGCQSPRCRRCHRIPMGISVVTTRQGHGSENYYSAAAQKRPGQRPKSGSRPEVDPGLLTASTASADHLRAPSRTKVTK